MKKSVGIIGATGYAGVELVRLLNGHSGVELTALCSVSFDGQSISSIYPGLQNIVDDTLENVDSVIDKCDVIFACMPHGHSEEFAKQASDKGKLFIDLGADFRLDDEAVYKSWYGLDYKHPKLHENAVYSIPELNEQSILNKKLIANPGCYPTSISLALAPLLKNKLIKTDSIIIDSKSGATGAGRGLALNTHFTELNEGFSAYKIASHRHTPEIEQMLSSLSGEDIVVTFTPHLLPVNRGILSTIYCAPKSEVDVKQLHSLFTEFYSGKQFVRILPLGTENNIKYVRCSNYCDISISYDKRANRIILVSTIDNMVKGASGQAIQNMNLCLGLDEKTGLEFIPPAF